jgi:hypothetical protein
MALMRVRRVSWLTFVYLFVLIGAQILPAPTSNVTVSEDDPLENNSTYDEAITRIVRIRTDKMARRTVPLVTTYSQQLSSHVSLSPPLIERTVTAFPRSHALRVHQRISVYRI